MKRKLLFPLFLLLVLFSNNCSERKKKPFWLLALLGSNSGVASVASNPGSGSNSGSGSNPDGTLPTVPPTPFTPAPASETTPPSIS